MAEEKILERVRKLIDKANSTTFEAEKQAFFDKAESLMQAHEIEQAELDAHRPKNEQRPIVSRTVNVGDYNWWNHKYRLLVVFAQHRKVRLAQTPRYDFVIVGYEADLDFVELLWTTTVLDFSSKMQPGWQKDRAGTARANFDANVYALKEAGFKWVQIAMEANRNGGNPHTGQPCGTGQGQGGPLISAYRRECKRLGVEPTKHTQRHDAYRDSFADSYVATINNRLYMMRLHAEEESGVVASNLPAVRSAEDRVNEEFWRLFPLYHPDEVKRRAEEQRAKEAARLGSMTPEELEAEKAAEISRKLSARMRDKSYDRNGWQAGDQAAKQVDLSGGRNTLKDERRRLQG